jgi:hypothetical protein
MEAAAKSLDPVHRCPHIRHSVQRTLWSKVIDIASGLTIQIMTNTTGMRHHNGVGGRQELGSRVNRHQRFHWRCQNT